MTKEEIYKEIKESFENWKKEIMNKYPVEFDNYGGIINVFITKEHTEYKHCQKWEEDKNQLGQIDTENRAYRNKN